MAATMLKSSESTHAIDDSEVTTIEKIERLDRCRPDIAAIAIVCAGCPMLRFCPKLEAESVTIEPLDYVDEIGEAVGEMVGDIMIEDFVIKKPAVMEIEPDSSDEIIVPVPVAEAPQRLSYLDRLLDDSIAVVVADSIRQKPTDATIPEIHPRGIQQHVIIPQSMTLTPTQLTYQPEDISVVTKPELTLDRPTTPPLRDIPQAPQPIFTERNDAVPIVQPPQKEHIVVDSPLVAEELEMVIELSPTAAVEPERFIVSEPPLLQDEALFVPSPLDLPLPPMDENVADASVSAVYQARDVIDLVYEAETSIEQNEEAPLPATDEVQREVMLPGAYDEVLITIEEEAAKTAAIADDVIVPIWRGTIPLAVYPDLVVQFIVEANEINPERRLVRMDGGYSERVKLLQRVAINAMRRFVAQRQYSRIGI